MSAPHGPESVSWRPATEADIPAIVELVAAVHAVENLEFAGGPEFWKWWLRQHDVAADTLLAVDGAGAIVGIAGSYGTHSDEGARAIVWLDPHPDRLDLEPWLLAWAVDRGRAQVAAAAHEDKVVRCSVEEHRSRRRALLERTGFEAARTFVEMERSLAADLPDARPVPDGILVVPWAAEFDEAARLVSNASFKDHWGSLPMTPEAWGSMVMDDDTVRRDCSFVAMEGKEAVAICLAEVDDEDDPTKLWVQRVGTVPAWQRRGLATALLSRSLIAAAGAGLETSALSVDEESDFDATRVYARLGYEVTTRSVTYLLKEMP